MNIFLFTSIYCFVLHEDFTVLLCTNINVLLRPNFANISVSLREQLFSFALHEHCLFYLSRIISSINILHEHFYNIHTNIVCFATHEHVSLLSRMKIELFLLSSRHVNVYFVQTSRTINFSFASRTLLLYTNIVSFYDFAQTSRTIQFCFANNFSICSSRSSILIVYKHHFNNIHTNVLNFATHIRIYLRHEHFFFFLTSIYCFVPHEISQFYFART